jgi:hypothetical protein
MNVTLRRSCAFAGLVVLAFALFPPLQRAEAQSSDLNYSIKEARAYAQKASLDKAVIEAVPKCNPDDDPKYKCDEGQWNHKPNCPEKIEIGAEGKTPQPKPPDVEPARGGAGETVGGEQPPPQSSPVRYNRFVALGTLSRVTGLKEARGLASRVYVDLSGRDDPEAHTESEAVGTQNPWEERCFPQENAEPGGDYTHMLSRSERNMATFHMTECNKMQCFEGAPGPGTFGGDAEKATAIVDLHEENGEVVGKLSAVVEDLSYGAGQLKIESVETFIEFRSDGTPQGLKWSVSSTASGVKLGGQPITLPPGQMTSIPGVGSVGMAAPYVQAEEDGTKLTIVAEGLTIGTQQQAVFVGGGEVYASFGAGVPSTTFPPLGTSDPIDPGVTTGGGGGSIDSPVGGIGSVGGSGGLDLAAPGAPTTAAAPTAAGDTGEVLVYEMATGRGALPSLIVLGALIWFFVMSRWLQRFAWGRKLNRLQPFRTIDWVYRAFVKT